MNKLLLSGGTKCRTIDKVDIFGDDSGVALYQLDGNANDTGGNYHGTETAITYGGGTYGRGSVFNGTTSEVITPFYFTGLTSYTISMWVNFNSIANGDAFRQISGCRGASANYTGFICKSQTTNKIQFRASQGNTTYVYSTSSVAVGEWYYITAVKDGATQKIYFNGVLEGTSATEAGITSVDAWHLGKYYANTLSSYNGLIDQVRIFNRAITATEVATLYAECAPTSIVDNANPFEDNSLKAMYQFNGNADDLTGVYNGTATNVTYSAGKFGDCAVFNGTALISTSFAFSANVFSYSIWATVTTVSSTIQSLIDFTTNRAMLSSGNGTNSYVSYYDGGTYRTFGAYSLPSNTRVLLTLVVNGTTAYLYANGVLKGSSVCTAIIPSGGMYFGRYAGSASGFLTGNLDQARIFNKALTPMEVASLYTETTPMEEPLAYLVDPFKDGSGKALYRLEGNALDESGNYNGTATSVTYASSSLGGREGVFNGSAYINVAMALTANTFSYSVWATVTTVSSTIQSLIDFSTGRAMLCSGNGTDTKLSYYDGTAYRTFGAYALTSATKVHIGLAVNGTSVELFINGVSQGTSACSAVTPSGNLYLGRYAGSAAGYLTGREDQPRIFNRVLTSSEFNTLYQAGA